MAVISRTVRLPSHRLLGQPRQSVVRVVQGMQAPEAMLAAAMPTASRLTTATVPIMLGTRARVPSSTMLARANFAYDITRLDGPRGQVADVPALLRGAGLTRSAGQIVDGLADLLVGGDLDAENRRVLIDYLGGETHFNFTEAQRAGKLHGVLYLMLSMPLAHLA